MGKCRTDIKFPTLMGSVGGWVFVMDVIRAVEAYEIPLGWAHNYTTCGAALTSGLNFFFLSSSFHWIKSPNLMSPITILQH